jgi:hypothetical protein
MTKKKEPFIRIPTGNNKYITIKRINYIIIFKNTKNHIEKLISKLNFLSY